MTRVRLFTCVVVCLFLGGGWLAGQDKPKLKGQLPQNWGKLGLSKDQIQKVYSVQADFRGKVEALKAQMAKLQAQEKAELDKVLTPEQRERLRAILTGKVPADPDKKPDDKKPDKK